MERTLKEAIKERDDYLKAHPEHQWFQDEIDLLLSNTPEHMRLEVLKIMMTTSALRLGNELTKLCQYIDKIGEEIDDYS